MMFARLKFRYGQVLFDKHIRLAMILAFSIGVYDLIVLSRMGYLIAVALFPAVAVLADYIVGWRPNKEGEE